MFKGKRVFVSGGAGVIGRELVARLQEAGAEIMVGDLKARPAIWPDSLRYRQGDLNSITVQELKDFDPNYFFHLAATFERSVETDEFWSENDQHNTRLSHHLMDAMKDVHSLQRVVFASSYLIYNPDLYQFNQPAAMPTVLHENDPIYPRNLCGMSKLLHEMELRFLSDHSTFTTVSARIYRVYGKNSRDIISRWIQSLLRGETIDVYRKEGMFDYIYAGDVAEGLFRLASSDAQGIVNLGNGHARRVEEVVEILAQHFPQMTKIEQESDILYEASEASMDRYRSLTNWSPVRTIEDTIPELIEHYRNQAQEVHNADKMTGALLISSLSKKVPLVQIVKKAAAKFGTGLNVIGADNNADCIGRHFVDEFWEMPRLDRLPIDELFSYCKEHVIKAIIPTRDGELAFYASHREQLKKHGIAVMVSNTTAVHLCLDKLEFSQFCLQEQLPGIPAFTDITQLNAASFVVKERFGAGSIDIALNVSREEAALHAEKLIHPIFQPFITGQEISADLYVDKKGRCKGVILRKREVIIGGESQITTSFRDDNLEALCASLAEKLGLYGHAVIQIIIDDQGGYHIIECNARLGGASRLSLELGLDSLYWFLLEARGVDLDEYPYIRIPQEKRLIRYAEDIIQ